MRLTMPRFMTSLAALSLAAATLTSLPAQARAAEHAVAISDFAFAPGGITVTVGDTVTWTNRDDAPHTVTSDDGSFDSGRIDPGQSWSMKFTRAGTFGYRCDFHPEMRGSVVVREAAVAPQKPKRDKPSKQESAGATESHPDHGTASGDQPNTAIETPSPFDPASFSPAALMGLGLLVIAGSIFRRPRARAANTARPMGGWRR